MKTDDLVRMANQIADFFRAYPHDEAVAGVADHISQFWDPRMREGLKARLASGDSGLSPLAREGAERALGLPA